MMLKQNNGKFKSFKNGEEEEDRRGSQQRNTIQHLNKQPEREREAGPVLRSISVIENTGVYPKGMEYSQGGNRLATF